MSERIQLSRRKGWRKPENTVVVARPTKWGNPFSIAARGREHAIAAFRAMLGDPATRAALDYPEPDEIRAELGGKNLACWCPLDQPCHADVLLELTNAGGNPAGLLPVLPLPRSEKSVGHHHPDDELNDGYGATHHGGEGRQERENGIGHAQGDAVENGGRS